MLGSVISTRVIFIYHIYLIRQLADKLVLRLRVTSWPCWVQRVMRWIRRRELFRILFVALVLPYEPYDPKSFYFLPYCFPLVPTSKFFDPGLFLSFLFSYLTYHNFSGPHSHVLTSSVHEKSRMICLINYFESKIIYFDPTVIFFNQKAFIDLSLLILREFRWPSFAFIRVITFLALMICFFNSVVV